MGSKNKSRSSLPAPKPAPPASGPPWILIGGVVAVGAVAGLMLYSPPGDESAAGAEPTVAANATPGHETPEADPELPTRTAPPPPPAVADRTPVPPADAVLPPLPLVPNMVPRTPEAIRDAYTFAAQRPDVLEYVPCFCGCETAGHARNADCFVAARNEDGSVREWDQHGMACTICIDVARDAMQLNASGASTDDIRAAVDSKYAVYPRQTPTPTPPAN